MISSKFSSGQSGQTPECVEKMTTEKYRSYEGILELPTGEKLFRVRIIRQEKCMDCIEGILYVNSLCNTIASFTIGRVPKQFVKDGYDLEWFLNDGYNTNKKHIAINRTDGAAAYFRQFVHPLKLIVQHADSSLNLFGLRENDILEISLQNGLRIYNKDKNVKQYKLIPQTQEFSNVTKNYFQWGDWGVHFIKEKDSSYTIELINLIKYIDNRQIEWQKVYSAKQ